MASIALNFVPPDEPNIVLMNIYEAPAEAGPYVLIEAVPMGTYPDYLTRYTTNLATSANGWVKIEFVDDKGAVSPMSQAFQGGTTTLVGEVVARAMQRDSSLDEAVTTQVAEAVIEKYFKTDPYDVPVDSVGYAVMEGLTLLVLAFSMQVTVTTNTTESYTAGLVSQKTGGSTTETDMKHLLDLAYKWLGISQSRIAQMAEIPMLVASNPIEKDQSRLLLTELP